MNVRAVLLLLVSPTFARAQRVPALPCATRDANRPVTTARLAAVEFPAFARIVRVDTLPASGPDAAFNPRSIDVRSDGRVLFVEGKAKRVTLRDASLRGAVQLGREGAGPGEYRIPADGAFGASGTVYVSDMGLSRITEYDASGQYVRTLNGVPTDIRALAPTSDGLLVAGRVTTPAGDRLATMLRPDGSPRWHAVVADPLLRDTRFIVDGVWAVAERGGTALVGASVVPRISRISTLSGAVTCEALMPASVWVPLDPRKMPSSDDRRATQSWIERASFLQQVQVLADGHVIAAVERTPQADAPLRDWVVFSPALAPTLRVVNVPARLKRIVRDTLWLQDETEDGDVRIIRAVLRGR